MYYVSMLTGVVAFILLLLAIVKDVRHYRALKRINFSDERGYLEACKSFLYHAVIKQFVILCTLTVLLLASR